ncbi:MAG: lycopene cyclase family protein [Acidimicrobiales bacterium]|nr:lycopene cyclase family protein [Acidimicrobiales bacterium]
MSAGQGSGETLPGVGVGVGVGDRTRSVRGIDDVLVIGGGPAGLAAAAAVAETGLRVVLVAPPVPAGLAAWPNTYGMWVDEVPPAWRPPFEQQWAQAVVDLGERAPRRLERGYGRVDREGFRAALVARAEAAGARLRAGRVLGAAHGPTGSTVRLADGSSEAAAVVVDASGHRPVLARRRPGRPAWQVAAGVVGRFARPPAEPDAVVLMDWRPAEPGPASRRDPDPTFLYAMDLGAGRWFVEETSLARRPALAVATCEERLRRRLEHRRAWPAEVEATERVLIPMGSGLPDPADPVVAFGGAASLVHPATGYQLGAALRAAPRLARAVADGLGAPGGGPATAARAAHRAVWPPAARRRRALHAYGLEALLGFDQARTVAFFTAFFDLPADRWFGYLTDGLTTAGLAATMAAVFGRVPPDVRRGLLRPALRIG